MKKKNQHAIQICFDYARERGERERFNRFRKASDRVVSGYRYQRCAALEIAERLGASRKAVDQVAAETDSETSPFVTHNY